MRDAHAAVTGVGIVMGMGLLLFTAYPPTRPWLWEAANPEKPVLGLLGILGACGACGYHLCRSQPSAVRPVIRGAAAGISALILAALIDREYTSLDIVLRALDELWPMAIAFGAASAAFLWWMGRIARPAPPTSTRQASNDDHTRIGFHHSWKTWTARIAIGAIAMLCMYSVLDLGIAMHQRHRLDSLCGRWSLQMEQPDVGSFGVGSLSLMNPHFDTTVSSHRFWRLTTMDGPDLAGDIAISDAGRAWLKRRHGITAEDQLHLASIRVDSEGSIRGIVLGLVDGGTDFPFHGQLDEHGGGASIGRRNPYRKDVLDPTLTLTFARP